MSLAIIYTRAAIGIQAPLVMVEVHISNGLPGLTLVGLPETTVKEARDRVRSALLNSGFTFPAKRITVSLAPADLPKEGGRYDLPIALAILAASGQIPVESLEHYEFFGELALSGKLRGIHGAIPAVLAARQDQRQPILALENEPEIGLMPQNSALVAEDLLAVCDFLHQKNTLHPAQHHIQPWLPNHEEDLQDIIGQIHAKRALEIAAAGGHNLLLLGPPGTGKTMLATRLSGLLPPLTDEEALETAAINSIHKSVTLERHWYQRPYRAPHHSSSTAALVGGGSLPKPGEISLAHNGILFLDELPEFERRALDALREPLESGEIIISRANAKVCYPARIQLIAAMNPSPTGHYQGVHNRTPSQQILRYLSRLSGPFLDRFDMSIEVPLLMPGELSGNQVRGESSYTVRKRVLHAREKQLQRANKMNAQLSGRETEEYCPLSEDDALFLERVLLKLGLSARAWHRILKVARTIADLNNETQISRDHISEAISYRSMDRLLLQLHKALQ